MMEYRRLAGIISLLLLPSMAFTQDGWFRQDSGTSAYLLDVYAADSLNCWAVGSLATILHTSDGGATWSEQSSPVAGTMYGVFFTDPLTGWVVGEFGNVLHTVDAGLNWMEQATSTNIDLWSVHFVDGSNGWAAGGKFFHPSNRRVIISTNDGGNTWITQHYESNKPSLHGIFFTDLQNGYAVGEGATIMATTDGGSSWLEQTSGVTGHLEDVYFTSPDTGFVVGQDGVILHTTDGGDNWAETQSGTSDWLGGIWFEGKEEGWAVGGSNDTATILHTVDGGSNWEMQAAGTDTLLRDVHFADSSSGWAVGAYGVIVHTTTGGYLGIGESTGEYAPGIGDLRVMPNPVAGSAMVSFSFSGAGNVSASLYDLNGRLVRLLHDGPLVPGFNTLALDSQGMPSGIYLLEVFDGQTRLSKKCLLLQ